MSTTEVWKKDGFFSLDEVIDKEVWDKLLEEALSLRDDAVTVERETTVTRRDGSFASPARYSVARIGPVFEGILRSRDVLGAVRERTGIGRLIPVRGGYNYYEHGDFMGVHRDEIRATVTLTFGITDNLGETSWSPDLRTANSKQLVEFVKTKGHLPVEHPGMPIGHRSVNAFDGYNIPHWRMPFEEDLGILGNLIYFEL
ncbi:hypothetical protein [Streptomyces chartreusis]|uniref:hypothetical protein n=1 Tax=Streptomyces chartreusis TaxID=1969 RepID=UPI0037A21B3D